MNRCHVKDKRPIWPNKSNCLNMEFNLTCLTGSFVQFADTNMYYKRDGGGNYIFRVSHVWRYMEVLNY